MTSNIGAEKLTKQAAKIGFQLADESTREADEYEAKKAEVLEELKEHFRPEFLNRVDHILVFNALNQILIRKIVKMHLDELGVRLKEQGYTLKVDPKVINLLGEEGFDPEYGARPVRRVVQQRIEDEIAEHIIKGIFHEGDVIHVIRRGGSDLDFMPGTEGLKQEKELVEAQKTVA
jgi:ATP-dependent Clp protease ATP-binding subunit ClpC